MADGQPVDPTSEKVVESERDRLLAADAPGASIDTTASTRAPIGAGRLPVPPIGSIGAGPDGASLMAPTRPVPVPIPGSRESLIQKDEDKTATFGVSGTPLTSAFLLDLGEYNSQLVGRGAIPTYEKMRRSDDMVAALLKVWRLPVMSAKWDVVEAKDENEKRPRKTASNGAGRSTGGKRKEVSAFVRENLFGGLESPTSTGGWESQDWQSVIYNATLMLDFGCSALEEIWRVDGNRARLRSLRSRQALTFYRWHTEPDGETLTAMEQYGYRGNAFLNVTVPIEKMCRFTYRQEGANFFGIPMTRDFYSGYFYKDRLKRIAAIASEKNMLGIPVWRLQKGFSPEDREKAYKFVTQVTANETTGAVEPPDDNTGERTGFRFETPAAQGRQALAGLMQWVSYYDSAMARAALAMFMLSGSTPFGNRSTTKEHSDFFLLAVQSLADQIRWELQVNTMRRLVWYNFGPAAPLPQLIAGNVQSRQLEDMVKLLKDLASVDLVKSDQSIRDWLREEIAAPEETDDGVIEKVPPAFGAPGEPKQPGALQSPEPDEKKQGLFYHLLPPVGEVSGIDELKPGDEFSLSRPVRFGERVEHGSEERTTESSGEFSRAASRGRLLLVRDAWSSNEWLKGQFRVRFVDKTGNIQADHVSTRT
jgi:hypothetical protein